MFYGGGFKQLLIQIGGTLFTIIFVTIVASILIVILKLFMKIRVEESDEITGLDQSEHGEIADYTVSTTSSDVQKYGQEFQGQLAHLNNPQDWIWTVV